MNVSTEQVTPENAPFEDVSILPNKSWFDPIGIRFFVNTTKNTITLRFEHDIRTVEVVIIGEPTEENKNSAAIKALEGEIIEEEV